MKTKEEILSQTPYTKLPHSKDVVYHVYWVLRAMEEYTQQFQSKPVTQQGEVCRGCGVPTDVHGTCCGWINAGFTVNKQGVLTDPRHPYFGKTYNEFFQSTRIQSSPSPAISIEELENLANQLLNNHAISAANLGKSLATAIYTLLSNRRASQPSREQVIEVLKDAVVQFNKNADHRLVNNIKESKEGYQATAIIKLFANSRASQEAETMKRNPVSFEQAQQQVERLNQDNLSNPWPLKDVLSKLIEASEILLHKKDYDGHGHEEIFIAVQRAKEIRQQVERLNGGGEEPDYGFCKEKGCDKKAVIDYNGCGHYVCQSHYDSLSKYFEDEYK